MSSTSSTPNSTSLCTNYVLLCDYGWWLPPAETLFQYCQILNALCIAVQLCLEALLIYVVSRAPQFHPNFLFLNTTLIADHILFTLMKLALSVVYYICPEEECFDTAMMLNKQFYWLEGAKLASMSYVVSMVLALIAERAAATAMLSTYERNSFSYYTLLLLIPPLVMSIGWVWFLDWGESYKGSGIGR